MSYIILNGDSLEQLKNLDDNTIDACVTDPPYGLAFMGKKWDYDVPSVELWKEVLRVLKPGAHLLSFGGTRTYHRMVVNIEDAGFEIRDQIMWLYGSGFPKSLDVSKAIDKAAGAEREVIREGFTSSDEQGDVYAKGLNAGFQPRQLTAPATDAAKRWQGWGTALKPANEPIVLARKPLEKGLTVAQNVLKWGTGAINVDGSRVAGNIEEMKGRSGIASVPGGDTTSFRAHNSNGGIWEPNTQGRWPANVLLDEEAAAALDAQSIAGGIHSAGKARDKIVDKQKYNASSYHVGGTHNMRRLDDGDKIGASRFFYVAKASKRERNAGLEGMAPTKSQGARPNSADPSGNNHPTVKPVKLMEYLIKLVTPPDGVVLDPFTGSGTTGVAALNLDKTFIGIERETEYCTIAEGRLNHASKKKDVG